jgi:hypothetical protein
MKLFLSQIQDIDNIPAYLKKLGQLSLEDNNIVLNDDLTGDVDASLNRSIGSGITINLGDGIDSDVTFNIVSLEDFGQEYDGSVGFLNRGWSTELSDIVLRNSSNNVTSGLRVLKENDILNGGSLDINGDRKVRIINRTISGANLKPSPGDILPGEIIINTTDCKLFIGADGQGLTDVREISTGALANVTRIYSENLQYYSTTSPEGNYYSFDFDIETEGSYDVFVSFTYRYDSTSKNASFKCYIDDGILISNPGEDGWIEWELKDKSSDIRIPVTIFRNVNLLAGSHTFKMDYSLEDDKELEIVDFKIKINS